MLTDILSLFTRQPDGKYMATVKGFKGTVRIVNSNPSYYWVKVYTQKPDSSPTLYKTVLGATCKMELDIPVTTQILFETERKPSEATIESAAENYVESVINSMVSGEGDVASLESLQRQINEQKAINDKQQEELERNAGLDDEQQRQIDMNREINEAQERGIGEDAVNDMVKKVFGE